MAPLRLRPDLSDPTRRAVPIRVEVTENKFRSLKFGIGLRTSVQDWRPYFLTRFRHTHLFHQLIQLNAGIRLGLAGQQSPTFAKSERSRRVQ